MNPLYRVFVLLPATMLLSGCMVTHTPSGDGKSEDVRVSTPFGGMHVNTDPQKVSEGLGLPVYPGAVVEMKKKKNGEDETTSADFNMGFGSFKVHVKAVGYLTPDAPDKVEAFYRKALGDRYGDVVTCRDHKPVGTPTHTSQGAACDQGVQNVSVGDKDENVVRGDYSLKAGSKTRQHIVSIETKDGKTRFGLVNLELPEGDDKKEAN